MAFGSEIAELAKRGEFERLISELGAAIAADRRVLAEPEVKAWCGRRWRNIFLSQAASDERALEAARKGLRIPGTDLKLPGGGDDRSDRVRLAERFLHPDFHAEAEVEMPPPPADGSVRNATFVVCPGLLGSMLPLRAFQYSLPVLAEQDGLRIICADAHPMRGCEANVADLVATIEQGAGLGPDCRPIAADDCAPPGDVFLIGYSKGTADALTMLALRPDLAPRVKALFCWGGAVGGSFLADDMYERVKDWSMPQGAAGDLFKGLIKTVFPIVNLDGISERLDEYDIPAAVRDLTTPERAAFLADHAAAIDALDLPIFNLTASTSASEVPFFQVQGYMSIAKHDADNDMQLTREQARMATAMATDLAGLHAHHWDISYDPFPLHTRLGSPNLDHRFPRTAALRAICAFTAELGLVG